MPSKETEDQKLSARANELYWQSGMSVNQIAEEMDLSKSRLYSLVQPHPAESPCPECQSDLVFPNRTAMQKGFVSCGSCSFEGEADGALTPAGTPAGSEEPETRTSRVPARTGPGAKRVLWGSALLGVAAGLYLAIRQRRS
jgi:hypothetical protein